MCRSRAKGRGKTAAAVSAVITRRRPRCRNSIPVAFWPQAFSTPSAMA